MVDLPIKVMQKLWKRCDRISDNKEIDRQLKKIDALVAITAAIFVFLGVSGSFRRCCGNWAFVMVAFAAHTLTPALIVYTLGLIQTAQFCDELLPIWATYLVVFLGNVDSYTAHSMGDIERWKSFKVDSTAKFILTSWMIVSYALLDLDVLLHGEIMGTTFVFFLLHGAIMGTLFVILFMKFDGRTQALKLASNSMMQKNDRYIADYMSTEHEWRDSSDEDPATMRGYRYLVRGAEEAKVHSSCSIAKWRQKAAPWRDGDAPHYRQLLEVTDEVITVEKVWNCNGRLLRGGDPDGQLKDLCLSFSLFKFIRLRFTGYSLPQEAHKKLRGLIQHMLSKENGYERVFRVIEVELAFLFDLFFTKYPVKLHMRRSVHRLLLLPILVAVPLLLLLYALVIKDKRTTVVSLVLITSILIAELTQFAIMIFSEWAKVTYICKYVRNERWQRCRCAGMLIGIMCRIWLVKPWGRQLRQYSLLKSCSYSPPKCIYNRLTAAYLDQKRKGEKQLAPTNLSEEVKRAIARSLGKYLEKGQVSLRLSDLSNEFSWACNLETTTHVIMVWHIATTFCEHEVPRAPPSTEQGDNFDIATKLSQYLAYLVVFAPKLLPGHPCRTEYMFSRAVSEAREKLRGSSVSMKERIENLKSIDNEQCQETIVARGKRLGMQLVNGIADEGRIWKVLADFWADMMLYVAPSNDTGAHAKYLTTGGEFLTHIWVLVSHVGITRDPHDGE